MLTSLQRQILEVCETPRSASDVRRILRLDVTPSSTISYLVNCGFLQVVGTRLTPVWQTSGNYMVKTNLYAYTGKKDRKDKRMSKNKRRLRHLGRKTSNGNKAGKGKRK